MKNIIGNILGILAVTAFLVLVVWAGYYGIRFLVIQFGMIDSREMPILVVASVVYIVGAILVSSAVRTSIQRNDKHLHPEKTALYKRIQQDWNTFEDNRKELLDISAEWFPQMQLWAGDEVLKRYQQMRLLLKKEDVSEEKLKEFAGKLLLEIRKDLGHKNRGINSKNIIKRN